MSQYRKIIAAVDLSEDSAQVVRRAQAIADNNGGCDLHVIHVIEPLSFAYGGDIYRRIILHRTFAFTNAAADT